MLFNSATFVVFLVIVLGIYYLPLSWRAKKFHLLVSSYVFYAAWNPPFVILVWISTAVDWFAAKGMARATEAPRRRLFLVASFLTNLGLLGYFKYGEFLIESFTRLVAYAGVQYQAPDLGIILPVGISFYTFQTLSYTIDVYRGELEPSDSFLDFALFVTFFPQLVAGPIVRASQFLGQLRAPVRATSDQMGWGFSLITIGLFQKVVLADSLLAPTADFVFHRAADTGFIDGWIGSFAFMAQVFFDFAGYSTCAIGAAMCFGFALPDNFRSPFASVGFIDLWRRWHISLSTWLRDYLYRPMLGSNPGSRRAMLSMAATFLLGGLWHGAAWHFVAWGGLHAIYLVGERWLRQAFQGARWALTLPGQLLIAMITYCLLVVSAAFFRAQTIGDAFDVIMAMFGMGTGVLQMTGVDIGIIATITIATLIVQWRLRNSTLEEAWGNRHYLARAGMLAAMITAIVFSPGEDRAFVYFQF